MELKEAIGKIMEGKVVVDEKDVNNSNYFLFGADGIIYYIHGFEITDDKKELAIRCNHRPSLLAKGWWENKWAIYEGTNKRINKILHDAVKGKKPLSKEDEEFFDEWYKKEFA